MPTYLIQFAQSHDEFRIPELESLAKVENVTLSYDVNTYKKNCPFLIVKIETEEQAARLVKRAILTKNIFELWGSGSTYEEVHSQVKAHPEQWPTYEWKSFKFVVSAFGSTCAANYQLDIINSFAYLGFKGPIDLKNPEIQFGVLEDYGMDPHAASPPSTPCYIYFGRLIGSGNRDLIQKFNVKKRKYIGNTTMDAELSLIMANQALAAPNKFIYDPFVGTGSFLVTCAHFGALTLGSDIDGRQIRGQKNRSIHSNIEQYRVEGRVLDTLVFDICHHPFREEAWFDAIVTDPPYGVRAGAKTLGRKDPTKKPTKLLEGVSPMVDDDYIPPKKPYEMSQVLTDLIEFAAKFLVIGGRLVYWLPTIVDEYSDSDVPSHPCLRLISNSEQNFGSWSRRLITMEKFKDNISGEHAVVNAQSLDNLTAVMNDQKKGKSVGDNDTKKPGHYLFREQYFTAKSEKRKKESSRARHKEVHHTEKPTADVEPITSGKNTT